MTFSDISPGATNTEATNNPMLMNNTGNLIRNVEVNATNLYGESNPSYALYAMNFTVKTTAGCGGTAMASQAYTQVSGASLPVGNYTLGDTTGQEELYYCLDSANSNLIAQSYSTNQAGAWTVKITA